MYPWLLSLATVSDKYISHIHFGEKFWLTLLFKKLFLKGCLNIPFRQLQLFLYFLGLGNVSAMGDAL